jgi:hypothetical protein
MRRQIGDYYNFVKGKKHIVFYIEDKSDWSYLREIYVKLLEKRLNVVALTSDKNDNYKDEEEVFFIGRGLRRIILFRKLRANLLVTTLTDLETLQLKRSLYPCEYIYIFHSLASIDAVYLDGAFDHYDYIFCSAEHQFSELRTRFDERGINAILLKHGYSKIDRILKQTDLKNFSSKNLKTILIAPTWGPSSLNVQQIGEILNLLKDSYRIILRLHPMTKKRQIRQYESLIKFLNSENITMQNDTQLLKDLVVSSLLITDWSGIALEFSLGLKKPTISINTPQKIRNTHYKEEIYQTYEKLIREKIGAIHSGPIDSKLLELIEKVLENKNSQDFKQNLEKELNRVYNIGNSDSIGSELIASIFLQNSLNVNAEKFDPSIY